MKVRSLEELSHELNYDLSWRRKELSTLKSWINKPSKDHTERVLHSRCGITILYAHWEGYVKKSLRLYLEYIATKKLKISQLSDNIIVSIVKNRLKKDACHTTSQAKSLVDLLIINHSSRIKIPYDSAVDTKSNLSYEVFEEITSIIGIDTSKFELKKALINRNLLGKRNAVGHGDYEIVDRSIYLDTHDGVISMLEELRNQLDNLAVQEGYLRTSYP